MRLYQKFEYLYPPRPEVKGPSTSLTNLEKQGYLAQPKLNGSCMTLFTDGSQVETYDRHKSHLQTCIPNEELRSLSKEGWTVLVGEYLNKNQEDENKKKFNHKFVIFDILVHQNNYLVGETFKRRQEILDDLFNITDYNNILSQVSDNVFRAKNFYNDLEKVWSDITQIQLYEGLVLKKENSRLEIGLHPTNNTKSQIKIRKETKNYQY